LPLRASEIRSSGCRNRTDPPNLSKIITKKWGGEYNSTKTITVFCKQTQIENAIHNHYAIHNAKSLATIKTFNSIQKVTPNQL